MTMFWHIIDRELIHLFAAPGIILALTFLMAWVQRKKRLSWLPVKPLSTVMLCALLVLPFAFFREPLDVAAGDPAYKSYIDMPVWVTACVLTPWVLLRLHKWWDGLE